MKTVPSDLAVESISDALEGFEVDFVVSGSIAAVESVKTLRALRRLGCEVTPYLTQGGSQFVTALALAWASAAATQTEFTGGASHLGFKDACVVAPASAGFITKLAQNNASGVCETLVTSYLGDGRPVFILPTMHGSLVQGYEVQKQLADLQKKHPSLHLIDARSDEVSIDAQKKKFPSSTAIANFVAHNLRKNNQSVMINMGGTCSYLDPVRFIGNISTGKTGSLVAEELYRQGFSTTALVARAQHLPESYSKMVRCETNQSMKEALAKVEYDHAVCMAAVVDYEFSSTQETKKKSSAESITLNLQKSERLLDFVRPKSGKKVAFKLENFQMPAEKKQLLTEYISKYQLSSIILNNASMEWSEARAYALENAAAEPLPIADNRGLAEYLREHFLC